MGSVEQTDAGECSVYRYIGNEEEYKNLLHSSGVVETETDVKIYFEVYGNGPEKLLMVMGLGGTAMMWLPNVSPHKRNRCARRTLIYVR